jgi:hypothetical protein
MIATIREDPATATEARATTPAPGGYVALNVLALPQEAQRLLAVALSPTFEIGLLAAAIHDQQEPEAAQDDQQEPEAAQEAHVLYQFVQADSVLLILDELLSVWPLVLPHISVDCMEDQTARIMRVFNAHQAHLSTQRRQRRHVEASRAQEPPAREEGADHVSMAR